MQCQCSLQQKQRAAAEAAARLEGSSWCPLVLLVVVVETLFPGWVLHRLLAALLAQHLTAPFLRSLGS
jgi:hypothetical protein